MKTKGASMNKSGVGRWVGSGVALLLLLGVGTAPASAATPIGTCGTYAGGTPYELAADLDANATGDAAGNCLRFAGSGVALNLNGHTISGSRGEGTGIGAAPGANGNNMTITGPGIVHSFETCIDLGTHSLVESVLAYDCETAGIRLGNNSKCVQCRVHDIRRSEPPNGIGIVMGNFCLLESSISEQSDDGAQVGQDCKVWDLVVDTVAVTGLRVGKGTSVARTVISHYHNGPGLDYTACTLGSTDLTANGCQDSSNSVTLPTTPPGTAVAIADAGALGGVITDCATNAGGARYQGNPTTQCPN